MAEKTNCKKNGKDYYRLQKVVGHKINAAGNEVPVKKEFYGRNKKEAESMWREYLAKKNAGLENKKQYFGIMADNWIYTFLVNEPKLKDRSKDLYIPTWKNHVGPRDIYHLPLDEVTAGTIQKFYNGLECSGNVIATINKVMSRFYKYLVTEGYATHNITAALTLKKDKEKTSEEIVIWSEEELNRILHSFEEAQNGFRLRFLIILGTFTGCRISELLGIKYSDITEKGLRISRQVVNTPTFERGKKTTHKLEVGELKSASSYRTIPLNDIVMDELQKHKLWQKKEMMKNGYRTEYIFTTDSGGFYDKRNINTACNRYYKKIGIEPKGFHTYRHTFGTMLCNRGIPIQTASVLLGHSDINITAKYYINVSLDEKTKAVNALADIMQA